MKKNLQRVILLFTLILGTVCFSKVYAATAGLTPSKTTVDVNESFTVTVNVTAGAWNLSINGGGLTSSDTSGLAGQTDTTANVSKSKTYTFKGTSAGTYIIKLSGDITDYDTDATSDINKTATITVKEASTTTTPSPKPSTAPSTKPSTTPSTKPSPVTLSFSGSSETVYAKRDVNVRSSYSTSSKTLGKLKAGESVTRTGVSDATSDGFYWSKVTFNGQTGYIASEYLSKTKPEILPSTEPSATPSEKSSDATLKSLSITGVEISPKFSPTITSYIGNVGDEVVEATVLAEVNNAKAKYEVTGNKDLQDGENIVKVTVTAEDGTVNVYEVRLTKGTQNRSLFVIVGIKESDERIAISLGQPNISENLVEYNIRLDEWLKSIEIVNTINDDKIVYEGLGTFDLAIGENKYTIKVKELQDNAEPETTEYRITINNPEKVVVGKNDNNKKDVNYKKIAIGAGIAAVAAVGIIGAIIYHKKQNAIKYGDTDYSFLNRNDNENYEDRERRRGGKHF